MCWVVVRWPIRFGFSRTPLALVPKIPLPQRLFPPSKPGHWSPWCAVLRPALLPKSSRDLRVVCTDNKIIYVWTGVNDFMMLSASALERILKQAKRTRDGALSLGDFIICYDSLGILPRTVLAISHPKEGISSPFASVAPRTKVRTSVRRQLPWWWALNQVCDCFCPPLGHRSTHDSTGVGPPVARAPSWPQHSTLAKIHLCHLHMAFVYFLDSLAWAVCSQMFRILKIIWGHRLEP